MNERFCKVGDLELCYESFGNPADPAALLVMGLGTQMIGWHDDFCAELAERGFHVIRFDNRDVGRSSQVKDVTPPTPLQMLLRRPPAGSYSLEDMADDAAGLLDGLGIDAAHLIGASMGGMIAQMVAVRHPEKVLSLVSIMSSTGHRRYGQPSPRIWDVFLRKPPRDPDGYAEHMLGTFRRIGSHGFEINESEFRDRARLGISRGGSRAGFARQLAAIMVTGDRTKQLSAITAPTLVIHGDRDLMVNPSGGRATARSIPGARMLTIEGMGHDLPRGAWPRILDAIAENAARTRSPAASRPGRRPRTAAPGPT